MFGILRFNAIEFTFSQYENFVMHFLFNSLIIPVVREKIKVRLALALLVGTSTTLAIEMIQTALLIALRTINILSI